MPNKPFPVIALLAIVTIGIQKPLEGLDFTKFLGPDNFFTLILVSCTPSLPLSSRAFTQNPSYPLNYPISGFWQMFILYLRQVIRHPTNYCSISLTLISCKIFKHMIHKNIIDCPDINNVLTDLLTDLLNINTHMSCNLLPNFMAL